MKPASAPLAARKVRAEMTLKELSLADVAALIEKSGKSGFSISVISRVLNARPDFFDKDKLAVIRDTVSAAKMPREAKEVAA